MFLLAAVISVIPVTHGFEIMQPHYHKRCSRWMNGYSVTDRTTASSTLLEATKTTGRTITREEDLELTRSIIMGGEASSGTPASVSTASTSESTTKELKQASRSESRPKNDLMIRAALGEPINRTPVWLFRQAGRHLPEYQKYKKETGKNFLELLDDPACVAECTMQPIRRYDLDAAILFSDILVIAEALNIKVTMPGGVGIQVPNPIQSPSDIVSLGIPDIQVAGTKEFIEDKLGHVLEAVRQIRTALDEENKSIPLIGFSAAPWTLLYYMLGGSSNKNTGIGVTWLNEHPNESQQLLDLLTAVVIEYMSAQVDNGAHMLQVFEAMGMMIDDANFESFALPCLKRIASTLKERHNNVPLMVFCRGACHLNDRLVGLGFDVITIDGSVDRSTARKMVGSNITLQGNYDPAELIESNGKTVESVRATARDMLKELGPLRLIANLGEGLGGKESPALVDAFVNAIHEESEELIKAAMIS